MAKFGISQNDTLTLVFDNKEDIVKTGIDLIQAFEYLAEKYRHQNASGMILVVLDIKALPQA